jgi:hypothetical protein
MSPLRARVEKGRLLLDEPTTLPEGTVVDVVTDDEGDDLTDDERRALHDALSAFWKSVEARRLRPAWRFSTSYASAGEPAGPDRKQTRRSAQSTTGGALTARGTRLGRTGCVVVLFRVRPRLQTMPIGATTVASCVLIVLFSSSEWPGGEADRKPLRGRRPRGARPSSRGLRS